MRTYETLVSGQRVRGAAADSERVSVFLPREPGGSIPLLLEVMLLRRVEERRDRVEAFADYALPPDHGSEHLGMPMGLPSIPDELPASLAALVAPLKLDQAILVYCGRGGLDSLPVARAV